MLGLTFTKPNIFEKTGQERKHGVVSVEYNFRYYDKNESGKNINGRFFTGVDYYTSGSVLFKVGLRYNYFKPSY